jgi:chemotaxis protein MotA
MFLIVGSVVVLASVFGGYMAGGGHMVVLFQPFEYIIIFGAAIGAYITSNRKPVLTGTLHAITGLLKSERFDKDAYLELLSLLYTLFKLAKSKGALALESHCENPHESTLFERFPQFAGDEHSVVFLCDYLRLLTLGTDNSHEMETLIDEDIATYHEEHVAVASAVQTMADGLPALGIVAAVLGVIKTMGSITEPPAVLGAMIGGALVGTFLGVFLAYGLVGPFATRLRAVVDEEASYYRIIQSVLVAHLHGNAAQISVEIGRGSVPSGAQPSFLELEEALGAIPAEG